MSAPTNPRYRARDARLGEFVVTSLKTRLTIEPERNSLPTNHA